MDYAVLIIGLTYVGLFAFIILFDIFSFVSQKNRSNRLNKESIALYREAKAFILNEDLSEKGRRRYLNSLSRTLCHRSSLAAFSLLLKNWPDFFPEYARAYLEKIGPVFSLLAHKYTKKSEISRGYYAYFLSHYDIPLALDEDQSVFLFLVELCGDDSLYTRENAFRALLMRSQIPAVISALKRLSRLKSCDNVRLLGETMSCYRGDKDHLISALFKEFASFSEQIQVGVINYARIHSPNYKEEILGMLQNPKAPKEVVLAGLRYFQKNLDARVLPVALALGEEALKEKDGPFLAVIALTLGYYPSVTSGEFLLKAITSPFYPARKNAADSLLKVCPQNAEYLVRKLGDPYALEMLIYREENRDLLVDQEDQDGNR